MMKFNTIGLFTDRQSQMVAFYRDIRGFKTEWNGYEPNVEMTYNSMRLIMFPRKDFEQMVSTRFDYPKSLNGTMKLSFALPTFEDVDKEYTRCLQLGTQGVMSPLQSHGDNEQPTLPIQMGTLLSYPHSMYQ
ncbi:hypothetical protein NXY00_02570 [Bacteroides sp. BFG-551]|nr:hypothetical protein [Bacteroides sp. BFG-551]